MLPKNVFLDGDWCWDMRPFLVTSETKSMVMDNIAYLLNSFIRCREYENVLFCWVLHERAILEELLSRLDTAQCEIRAFSLVAAPAALEQRLRADIAAGIRTPDALQRSLARLVCYPVQGTEKIDVSGITPAQAALQICALL